MEVRQEPVLVINGDWHVACPFNSGECKGEANDRPRARSVRWGAVGCAREITLDPSVGCWKESLFPKLGDGCSATLQEPLRRPRGQGLLSSPAVRVRAMQLLSGRKGVARAHS